MELLGTLASIALGAAFVLAGASKLAAGQAWPPQARQLGAPRWAIPVVPWLELLVGAALIAQLLAPWPAAVAIVMLVVFTALIALRLSEGKHPACACFGAWSAKPIGAGHLLRNGLLLALAVVAIAA